MHEYFFKKSDIGGLVYDEVRNAQYVISDLIGEDGVILLLPEEYKGKLRGIIIRMDSKGIRRTS